MLLAILEFSDYVSITAIVAIVAMLANGAALRMAFGPANRDRLVRVEHKLDLLLTHAGLDYTPPTKATWQALADEGPDRKIAAVGAYRKETGAGLADAKRAVEEYIEGRQS